MKTFVWGLALCTLGAMTVAAKADVYIGGHADLGVGFANGGLELHLHAETQLNRFGGGFIAAGEYEPNAHIIGVPGSTAARPAGANWNFLAPNAGDAFWFLPSTSSAASQQGKPFLGIATEELTNAAGWTSPLTWTFNSISVVSGQNSSFALWQNDAGGNPIVFASSLVPTPAGSNGANVAAGVNSWAQVPLSHDHFFYGFSGEGVYDVSLTIRGTNAGVAPIAAGPYSNTAIFRFATGNAIASVPEPSSLVVVGFAAASCLFHRRRSRLQPGVMR